MVPLQSIQKVSFQNRFVCTNNFSNMIMMMLVLRMGGLGSEIDESEKQKSDDLRELSLIDIFHYAFSYMGLLAGPYVRWVVLGHGLCQLFTRKIL